MSHETQRSLPVLLSVKEAAAVLRVGKTKVRRLAFEGKLDGYSVAGVTRISEESIKRYLRESRVGPRHWRQP